MDYPMKFGKRVSPFEPSQPMPPVQTIHHSRHSSIADDIDFEIHGTEAQFVEIELDPGESAIAEAGSMMFKHPDITMETAFGDASDESRDQGLFGKFVDAGKRLVTGEGMFTTVFTHRGHGKARVSFSSPYPGHILPVRLDETGHKLICQKDAFLCAARGVSIGIEFQRKISTGLFGGEGFIMQKLEGDGWVFVHVGGTVTQKDLAPGEELHIDTGCVAAYTSTIDFDIQPVGSVKSMLFGGEGMFLASLRGPGRVWIQSLPFSRLAGRMTAASVGGAGDYERGGTGEGSILGGLGRLIDGD